MRPRTCVTAFLLVGVLIAAASCGRGAAKRRIRDTQLTLESALSSNNEVQRELKQQIMAELEKATPQSIESPKMAAAVIWGSDEPILEFWWIAEQPAADGVILRWSSNQTGNYLKVPGKLLAELLARARERQLVEYQWAVPLGDYIERGLKLPESGMEVALARDGQAISPFIECKSYLAIERAMSVPTTARAGAATGR